MLALAAAVSWQPAPALAHAAKVDQRLPVIGEAPGFALTNQDGARVALRDLRGKVVAVTFIYTSCADTCPVVTAKMAAIQKQLGADFGTRVRFVSITVDPEVDTPAALRRYATSHGADLGGWSFLTGTQASIEDTVRRYGAFARRLGRGNVDHLFLTSLIDRDGRLRVQYLGYRFDPEDLLRDLRALASE